MALALTVVGAAPARAATFDLDNCSNSGFDVLALWDAIIKANNETDHPGPDTIRLAPGCTYTLRSAYPNSWHVLPAITSSVTIVGRNATLDHRADDASEHYGIFDVVPGAGLTVTDMTLENWRGHSEGSFFRNAGDVLAVGVTIDGNDDVNAGPAIVNQPGANFTLLKSEMVDLLHGASGTRRGAAIHNEGTMYVVDSDVRNNNVMNAPPGYPQLGRAVTNRGYLALWESYVRVTETVGASDKLLAGGIHNDGHLDIRGSLISGHEYKLPGAGVFNSTSGTLAVARSTFTANRAIDSAPGLGGAVYNAGTASFLNTTFLSNFASTSGGALYNTGSATFTHATLSGSDIRNDDSSGFTTVTSSILDSCVGTLIDGGTNLVRSATTGCPGAVGNANLSFWSFAHSGKGPLLRPGPGSAAVDAAQASTCPTSDQRDVSRPRGGACDIGAYENRPPAAPVSLTQSLGSNPSSTGDIGLDWPDVVDADHDPLTYRLYARDFDDPAEALLTSTTTSSASLSSLAEGTYRFRLDTSDGNHVSAGSAHRSIVVDKTPPSSPTVTTDRSPEFTAADGTGWYRDQVDVTFAGSKDPLLLDGSKPSGIEVVTPAETLQTSGAHVVSGETIDAAGNVSPTSTVTLHVDADAPSVAFSACPATVILGSVTELDWTASDAHSGLATAATGSIAVDTATVGARILTASAEDNLGHTSVATCTVQVVYDFDGFFAPVQNPPALNHSAAGRTITMSFGLGGDQGLDVLAPGYPVSTPISCDSTEELTTGEATATPRGLIYGSGRYTYAWRTDRTWSGTCRQFIALFADGTYHRANVSFR